MTAKEKAELETELRKTCIKEPEKYKMLRSLFAMYDTTMNFAAANGKKAPYDTFKEDDLDE